MPAHLHAHPHGSTSLAANHEAESPSDTLSSPRVYLSHDDEDAIAEIRRTLTEISHHSPQQAYSEPHSSFDKFLEAELQAGRKKSNLGVCFQSLSTWGDGEEHTDVKTLGTALWRTLTFQDVYEWTIQPWLSKKEPQSGRPLIRDFSGAVRSGEIMLVLGRPGAGCSTFLRTIAGHHSSFLGVTGSLDYSGLSLEEVKKHYRGQVAYVPEDDVHFPTLTVQQTLEFALQSKTPQRYQDRISRYLEIYGRVFGMSHTMNTLVGNEYIRGVSGGERKRISIIESLATDSSVSCWDNSTRGLDASSALDYARSLRIMTDTCGKATLMTLYQASDAIYDLVDKVLLIDEGRMLFQGPAREAKRYFEDLGYECAEMQTISDFLTSITVPERRRFRPGWEHRAPKGPIELEETFRKSPAYHKVQCDVQQYEDQCLGGKSVRCSQTDSDDGSLEDFKKAIQTDKSRFVSPKSPYTISVFRQVVLCAKRQLWQIRGHMSPLYIKIISSVVYGLLVGSMFYNQPQTTAGMYSRGGVIFYSSILLAWLQMSELEEAMQGRDILSRQKKFAFVRPSAYTTPALYTYEATMAAEFHNTNFTCSPESVVPSGANYTNIAYQTCGYAGSQIGTTVVNGDDYLAAQYGFSFGHVWRNFGILCLFTVVYIACTCWLSEIMEWEPDSAGPIQYKKSRRSSRRTHREGSDEESNPVQRDATMPDSANTSEKPGQAITGTMSTFTWDNLELFVQVGKETRKLLNGVSGYCKPGTLTALVGASGAGKSTRKALFTPFRVPLLTTTVLTALTRRPNSGKLTGTMYVDGHAVDESFNRQIGYCQQMDIHDESSTVREAFEFSALLRQNPEVPDEEKLSYVNTVIETLELIELQNALIGSLDIEKKKRVTIGVELCARPELLLFLDEPTSGLDSQGASSIVALLRRLADQGLAILCTIHQANQQQFEEFDRVLALSPGGSTYYFGEVGQSGCSIFEYFSKHGHKPENVTNAADYLIEVVVGGMKDTTHQVNWADVWNRSKEADLVKKDICDIRSKGVKADVFQDSKRISTPPLYRQVGLLTKRTLRQYWRSPEYPYSRLYASFLHALINGLTYLQIGNSSTDLQSKAFSCFLVLMLVPEFINAISMRFIMNREIWKAREDPSGVYGWVAFCTAQIVSEIPYAIISAVIFYVLYYFIVGLPLGFAAGYSFLMFFLFFLFATSWGQWIAALSADSMVAATLMPFFIIMCELFNGILQPHDNMPVFWKYTMYYATPFTYWIGGVLTAVLRGMPVICDSSELTIFESPPNMTCGEYAGPWLAEHGVGYLSNPDDTSKCGYCKYSYGDDYLSGLGLDSSKIWPYFGIFFAFVISNYLMILKMYEDRQLGNHNEQTSTSPDSILVPRRRRPALSCTVCRRRKLKCDRALPCSQCVKSKTPDLCAYSGPAPGQPLETRPIRTASDRANVPSNHTSPGHGGLYVFDSRHQSTHRITKPKGRPEEVQELRHRVQVLESALSRVGSIQTPDSSACESVSDYGPRITSESLLLSEDVKHLPGRACFRGKNGKTRYCGRCHSALSFSFFKDVASYFQDRRMQKKSKSPEYLKLKKFRGEMLSREKQDHQRAYREKAFTLEEMLPHRRVADELVNLYLSTFETTYRILHVPTFLKQYETYWAGTETTDMAFIAKLLAVMAASSCFFSPSTRLNEKDTLHSAAGGWIMAVQSWISSINVSSTIDFNMLQIQCILILARQADATDGDVVWISSGSLIRSAMMIGLHRNPARFPKMTRFWAEMRRRLWATILELDLQSALDGGMPPSIDLDEYDCDPPSNYDDDDLMEDLTEDVIPKDAEMVTRSSFQVLLSQSLSLRVRIAKLVNGLKFTLSYDEALRLSEQLVQHRDNVLALFPDNASTSISLESLQFTRSFFVFIMVRFLLVLHRPFSLSVQLSPKFSYSRKICLESSLEMLSQLDAPAVSLPEAQACPHLGQLSGGMFRDEFFHAAITVCVEVSLQATEFSSSKQPSGQISSLSSLNDLVRSQQDVLVRAVEHTLDTFGSRISPRGKGCKAFIFLAMALASVKARLNGEDALRKVEQVAAKSIKDCERLIRGKAWIDIRREEGPVVPDTSTPSMNSAASEIPFDPALVPYEAVLTTLGLQAAPGEQASNHAVAYLVANWLISFGLFSTRREKLKLGIDHNQAPRDDLAKFGEAAVQSGKITRQTLNRLKRQEASMANSAEHYPLFVAAILVALHAGVSNDVINRIGLWYAVSRLAFGLCYKYIESLKLSFVRSFFWWSGNICCFTAFWFASKKL
ncbi:hypothetical protein BDV37DRAFT_272325 [Aspergillus pseudonomiae]|uniref:ABC-2 type transporter-domain-containing protein n=1 Tax=Aspergillus pseudonomiae TaxID=1506151 RepID=A0A5N7DAR2_9EURO|nr:uncharacterized protein BDV37DRAFT_272325 [Aspergillus pseudonomiae]KAE8403235.1 hypothetical protein BDV37DRAFT_272325 [Aspergillus pseudonomiae]